VRNLIDERPTHDLHGRLAWSRSFVDRADIEDRDVLDIGCGFGWFELFALEGGARSITGVEPTERDLETVRRHLTGGGARFEVASATDLPFDSESFDTVVCWEVLEHLPRHSEPAAFGEVSRVLRPGGVFYLSTPHAAPLPTLTDPAWWLIGHRHYSRRRVAELTQQAGLVVEVLEARGRLWSIVEMLDLYVSKWILRRPAVLQDRLRARAGREWQRAGFTNLFLRCRKPARQTRPASEP
jgi:2-polyprenyl-3-methyl-5-hydroxy-6-metoxy-1,4-benzoquinol methylase